MFLKANQYLRQQKVVSVYAKPLGRKNGEEGRNTELPVLYYHRLETEEKREKKKI